MPVYKKAVRHRVSIGKWLKFQARDVLVRLITKDSGAKNNHVQPVFIVGCGHSGTTLLANRLGLHPKVYTIRQETNLFFPSRLRPAASDWLSNSLNLVSDFGKEVLVEKTPKHVHVVSDIIKIYPGAIVLGLTRNPLDNIASLKKRFGCVEFCMERWIIDNSALLAVSKFSQLSIIKYENLVCDYDRVLNSIFERIGVDSVDSKFIEEQAKHRVLIPKNENQKTRYSEVSRGVENKIGMSAKGLTDDEKDMIIYRVSDLSLQLGYPKDFLNSLKGNNQ